MNEQLQHVMDIPEGSIPTFVVEVVAFLDDNAQSAYRWRLQGDVEYAQVLGALELVKDDLLAARRRTTGGSEPL